MPPFAVRTMAVGGFVITPVTFGLALAVIIVIRGWRLGPARLRGSPAPPTAINWLLVAALMLVPVVVTIPTSPILLGVIAAPRLRMMMLGLVPATTPARMMGSIPGLVRTQA